MACNNFPNCKNTTNVPEGDDLKEIPVIKVDAVDHRTKEFHLTVEECRARALESAIECVTDNKYETSDLLTKAKIFEVYIREGVSNANGQA